MLTEENKAKYDAAIRTYVLEVFEGGDTVDDDGYDLRYNLRDKFTNSDEMCAICICDVCTDYLEDQFEEFWEAAADAVYMYEFDAFSAAARLLCAGASK